MSDQGSDDDQVAQRFDAMLLRLLKAQIPKAWLVRLFWEALDRLAYAVTDARLWLFELMHGSEAATGADEKRETDRERLQKAFSDIDISYSS